MEATGLPPNADAPTEPAAPPVPTIPKVDHPPETPDEVASLAQEFAAYRAEVAALRKELQKQAPAALAAAQARQQAGDTPAEREKRRLAEIADHSHYCPGCGLLYKYPQRCSGPLTSGHAPIEVVSTDELSGDPNNLTAAPVSIA